MKKLLKRFSMARKPSTGGGNYSVLFDICNDTPVSPLASLRIPHTGSIAGYVSTRKPSIPSQIPSRWYQSEEVMVNIFGFLGLGQLFLGQSEEISETLCYLRNEKPKNNGPTRCVCRKWAVWASLISTLDLEFLKYKLTDKILQRIVNSFPELEQLFIIECQKVKFEQISFASCRGIQVLRLNACLLLNDDAVKIMTAQLPNLKELYLESCSKLTSPSIVSPSTSGPALEILDITCCSKLTNDAVNKISMTLPNLKQLFMCSLDLVDDPEIGSGKLELLMVDRCSTLKFAAVVRAIQKSSNLKYISCSDCEMFEKVEIVFPPSSSIEEINISGSFHNDNTVASILSGTPLLRILDISNSETIVNPVFPNTCDNLEFLIMNQCAYITDEVVTAAVTNLKNLRHLSVNNCDCIIRPDIVSETLILLDVSSCMKLLMDKSNESWIRCPNLEVLFIGFNPPLTDMELEVLGSTLPKLKELNLFRASGLKQPNLEVFPSLEIVIFNECWGLVEGFIENLSLPSLRTVYVTVNECVEEEDDTNDMDMMHQAPSLQR